MPIGKLPIWAFVGPEGSGKSLAMTAFALMHYDPGAFFHEVQGKVPGGPIRCFEGFEIRNPKTQEVISKPIDVDEWATMANTLRNSVICIDELQNWLDSMRHNSQMSRLFGYFGMQRRRLQVGVFYTIQNWGWANDRVRWLTHLLTVCKDYAFTPAGREEGIAQGSKIKLETYDVKGFYTGAEWQPYPALTLTLYARPFWDAYDSFTPTSLLTAFTKVKVNPREIEIDAPGSRKSAPVDLDTPIPSGMAIDSSMAYDITAELMREGIPAVKAAKVAQNYRRRRMER